MRYAFVKDNQIINIDECPICTETVSNFYLLPDEDKKKYGYLPVIETQGEEDSIQLQEDKVILVKKIDLDEKKKLKLIEIDCKASSKIYSIYPEYKQANAALGIYDDITKNNIISFIQLVRARVKSYKEQVNSGNLDIEVSYDDI